MSVLLLIIYSWTCWILYRMRVRGRDSPLPALFPWTPHGAVIEKPSSLLSVSIGWGLLAVALCLGPTWMDQSDWIEPGRALVIFLLCCLELGAVSAWPTLAARAALDRNDSQTSDPEPFPEQAYPLVWIRLDPGTELPSIHDDQELSSAWRSLAWPGMNRLPSRLLPRLRRHLPQAAVLPLNEPLEKILLRDWSELVASSHRQAEKALQAQAAENRLISEFGRVTLECHQLQEANRVLQSQLTSLRVRQREAGPRNRKGDLDPANELSKGM